MANQFNTAISVARLTGQDIAGYRALMALFAHAFEDDENYRSHQPSDGYVRSFLETETNIALIAKTEGKIIGGLMAYVLPKFEQERAEIYIYDLATHIDRRRAGVATHLINALRELAPSFGHGPSLCRRIMTTRRDCTV